MALREYFIKFMTEYGQEQADANATGNYKRPFSDLVRHDIVDCIKDRVDNSIYLVDGSVGKGRWAKVPWIAVFDKRITTSAQRGVYIVYLLNKDSKELFLTLNQGATTVVQGGAEKLEFTGMSGSFSKKAADDLKRKAESIRNEIGNGNSLSVGEINTGSTAYDSGCIFYKKYTVDDMPDDEVLFSELSLFIASYQEYYNLFSQDETWWPSLNEYNPGLTKFQWIDYIQNNAISETQMRMLARLYSYGDNATMVELEEKYGGSSDAYRNILTSLGEKAVKYFGIPACNEPGAKYWPCMYLGKQVEKDRRGNYAYKIRPELREALEEIDIMKYLDSEEREVDFELPEAFRDSLSRRFVTSLLAKPFVILTGNSGTGKTRIATRFAKCLEVQLDDGGKNYELISVGADWTDNTAILGYYNPMSNEGKGEYIETPILKLFARAADNPEYPFFLILDEMNLSHVERYFADFLSHMETPETGFKIEGYSDSELTYPDNLFVIGTVNIDETTYMFSPKVLDRANVIEFKPDKTDVMSLFDQQSFIESIDAANDQTTKAFMTLARKIREDGASIDLTTAKDVFDKIYTILEKNDFEFAFRTVKEICRYLYAASEIEGNGFNLNNSIDEQIVQKLLPKIHGNRRVIGDMLTELIKFAEVDNNFVISAEKLKQMEKKLENTQYVSFI